MDTDHELSDKKRLSRLDQRDPRDATGKTRTKFRAEVHEKFQERHGLPVGYTLEFSTNHNAKPTSERWEDFPPAVLTVRRPAEDRVVFTLQRGRFSSFKAWLAEVSRKISEDQAAAKEAQFELVPQGVLSETELLEPDATRVTLPRAHRILCRELHRKGEHPMHKLSFIRFVNRQAGLGRIRKYNAGSHPEVNVEDLERALAQYSKAKTSISFRREEQEEASEWSPTLRNDAFREISTRRVISYLKGVGTTVSVGTRDVAKACAMSLGQARSILETLCRARVVSQTGQGKLLYRFLDPANLDQRFRRALKVPLAR